MKIWLGRVAQKWKNADVLQDDLTARSVSSKSPGGTFGTFDRQLARAMALCTRHYRVDRSLGIYNEATGKVNLWQGLRVLRKFFLPEPDAVLRQFKAPGLLIFGEHEVLYDPHTVGRKAQKLMGDIRVEVVAGAGHAAIYDRPEVVDAMVTRFLQGMIRRPRCRRSWGSWPCGPASAMAHEGTSLPYGSFIAGLAHPVLGVDHFLAMVSVGIVSAQIGGRAIWTVPGPPSSPSWPSAARSAGLTSGSLDRVRHLVLGPLTGHRHRGRSEAAGPRGDGRRGDLCHRSTATPTAPRCHGGQSGQLRPGFHDRHRAAAHRGRAGG